jgi:hypothetical protein
MISKSLMIGGSIYFGEETDPEKLASHLADCLYHADAKAVDLADGHVAFKAGVFRMVGNWNVLVPFGSGELRVDPVTRQVYYRLSARQLVVVASFGIFLMATFVLFSQAWQPLVMMPFIWLWVVGGNLAIGVFRFERFLCRSIESAPKHAIQTRAT